MLIPVLTALPAYAVLQVLAGLVFLAAHLFGTGFARDPRAADVRGGRIYFGFAVIGPIIWALVSVFHYSWPQVAVIVTVESLAWGSLLPALTDHVRISLTRAADPRDLLVVDLAAFLVVASVSLENDGEPKQWLFPQPSWAQQSSWDRMAYWNGLFGKDNPDRTLDPIVPVVGLSAQVFAWRHNHRMRVLFADGLESAADRTESHLSKIAIGGSAEIRSAVRHTAAKIGATLRKYAVDIVLGGTEHDRALPGKLTQALTDAAWGRWASLGSEDPTPVVRRLVGRFGPRLATAAALVAVGILAPIWFHAEFGEAAGQFRTAVFTTAALSLTEAPRVIIDQLSKQAQSFIDRPH
ncbi:hypothetical protein [Nocardia sp. R7R-8]|uniref:hypothetical protein n=1 Tax=Nocardia sp. R7R-8 TaxID=3459304 RepID=UPI00403D60D1